MEQVLFTHYWVPVSITKMSDLLREYLQLFSKIDIILNNGRLNKMDTSYILYKDTATMLDYFFHILSFNMGFYMLMFSLEMKRKENKHPMHFNTQFVVEKADNCHLTGSNIFF